MTKLTPQIREFIEAQIKGNKAISYPSLIKEVARRFKVKISKATVSKRARALRLKFRRGRKRIVPVEKRPSRSIFLDCAGAFFLKGAELEAGLLSAINQLFLPGSKSARARRALGLARQINAFLLYAPIFGLHTVREIADYQGDGLLYLTGQETVPAEKEIAQYLQYLVDQKLLLYILKEVRKVCQEVLSIRIDFANQSFYLDGQSRTVWPSPNISPYFSTTLSKINSYVNHHFESPSLQRPLILQVAPGYTFLPKEVFNLIHCLERAQEEPISRIVAINKSGQTLAFWRNIQPKERCYFIFPLSPWQYARLQGTRIIRNFREYRLGPEREPVAVADARINLVNPQLNENIELRAALVRRKEERIALASNISPHEERYVRRIADFYFFRWPDEKVKTYYDLLEEAHEEILTRSRRDVYLTSLLTISYGQNPQELFRLFLEHLNRIALARFFPSEYEGENLKSMQEKFYQQPGFLKIRQNLWEVFLRPFSQKKLQEAARRACQRFNQSGIKFPTQKSLYIYLQ